MIALIQKVKSAKVTLNKEVKSEINNGFVIYLGIHVDDTNDDIIYTIKKILKLRIFPKESNKFDISITDLKLQILIISNFTLNAKTRTGNRPDFSDAMLPKDAQIIYDKFIKEISKSYNHISTGEFGGDMRVESINDGPVNIIIDSTDKNKSRSNF